MVRHVQGILIEVGLEGIKECVLLLILLVLIVVICVAVPVVGVHYDDFSLGGELVGFDSRISSNCLGYFVDYFSDAVARIGVGGGRGGYDILLVVGVGLQSCLWVEKSSSYNTRYYFDSLFVACGCLAKEVENHTVEFIVCAFVNVPNNRASSVVTVVGDIVLTVGFFYSSTG